MKTLQVSEETYNLIKDQLKQDEKIDINSYNDMIGQNWFFRTVTYHMLGKVTKIVGNFLQLESASWIPDSGRFMNFIKEGKPDECEPVGTVFINLSTIVDMYQWNHDLLKDQL